MSARRLLRTATRRRAAPADRGARRRLETRTKLVSAARTLMAKKGIGATSIQEITDTADVGFGSFYNHFDSKEAIAAAVMDDGIESFGDAADRLTATIDDPAEVLAVSTRHAITRAAADEAWGWFLLQSALARADSFAHGLGQRFARDVGVGLERRRFKADDPPAAMLAAAGAILTFIAARLHGNIGDDAPERAATVVLTLLGIPAKEARRIAHRPLPAIDDTHLEDARR